MKKTSIILTIIVLILLGFSYFNKLPVSPNETGSLKEVDISDTKESASGLNERADYVNLEKESNWQTYKFTDLGFEIEIPDYWIAEYPSYSEDRNRINLMPKGYKELITQAESEGRFFRGRLFMIGIHRTNFDEFRYGKYKTLEEFLDIECATFYDSFKILDGENMYQCRLGDGVSEAFYYSKGDVLYVISVEDDPDVYEIIDRFKII